MIIIVCKVTEIEPAKNMLHIQTLDNVYGTRYEYLPTIALERIASPGDWVTITLSESGMTIIGIKKHLEGFLDYPCSLSNFIQSITIYLIGLLVGQAKLEIRIGFDHKGIDNTYYHTFQIPFKIWFKIIIKRYKRFEYLWLNANHNNLTRISD